MHAQARSTEAAWPLLAGSPEPSDAANHQFQHSQREEQPGAEWIVSEHVQPHDDEHRTEGCRAQNLAHTDSLRRAEVTQTSGDVPTRWPTRVA